MDLDGLHKEPGNSQLKASEVDRHVDAEEFQKTDNEAERADELQQRACRSDGLVQVHSAPVQMVCGLVPATHGPEIALVQPEQVVRVLIAPDEKTGTAVAGWG